MRTEKHTDSGAVTPEPTKESSAQLASKCITKARALLSALIDSPNGLTGRRAWTEHGDSCFNTTACKIQSKFGVRIEREWIEVEGRYGPVHVKRYWLSPAEKAKARQILGREAA